MTYCYHHGFASLNTHQRSFFCFAIDGDEHRDLQLAKVQGISENGMFSPKQDICSMSFLPRLKGHHYRGRVERL